MQKDRQNTFIVLGALFAATLLSPAASAADPYDFRQWAMPGSCAALPSSQPQNRTLMDGADPQDVSDRLVKLLLSLHGTPTDLKPLRLSELCRRLPLNLFELPMPPPRPEPWNPNPAPELAVEVSATNNANQQQFTQQLDVTYFPAAINLRYSVVKYSPPDEDHPYGSELPHADVGAQCPLRAGVLRQRLRRAGYAQKMYGETPPTGEFASTDNGPSYQFTQGDRSIRVLLQGDYAEQRKDPASKCVALIAISIETGHQGQ